MPYTLSKGLLWFLVALLIGLMIGWLLRSIAVTRQLRAARAARAESAELEQLRARLATLERVEAERDRLQTELHALRASAATTADPPEPEPAADRDHHVAAAEEHLPELDADGGVGSPGTQRLANEIDPLPEDSAPAHIDRQEPPLPEQSPPPASGATDGDQLAQTSAGIESATAIVGKKIKPDDLTAIEGIGPAIAGLCNGIGIQTWADLADTEVSLLRTMLADAGPRFSVHEPDTWPQQAALLASGRWQEFDDLVRRIATGKLSG